MNIRSIFLVALLGSTFGCSEEATVVAEETCASAAECTPEAPECVSIDLGGEGPKDCYVE